MRLETWWDNAPAEGAAPEVGCYFWCREDDSLVLKPPPDADSIQKELENLVRASIIYCLKLFNIIYITYLCSSKPQCLYKMLEGMMKKA